LTDFLIGVNEFGWQKKMPTSFFRRQIFCATMPVSVPADLKIILRQRNRPADTELLGWQGKLSF